MPDLNRATLYDGGYLDGRKGDLNGDKLGNTDDYYQKYTEERLRLKKSDYIFNRYVDKKILPKKFGEMYTFPRLQPLTPAGAGNILGDNIDSGRNVAMYGKNKSINIEWYGVYQALNDKAEAQTQVEFINEYYNELSDNLAETQDKFAREAFEQQGNFVFAGGHATAADLTASDNVDLTEIEEIVLGYKEYTESRPDTGKVNDLDENVYYASANFVDHKAPRPNFAGKYPVIISPRGMKQVQSDPKYKEFLVSGISDKIGMRAGFETGAVWGFQDIQFIVSMNNIEYAAGDDVDGAALTVDAQAAVLPTRKALVHLTLAGLGAQMIVHSKGSAGSNDPLNRVYRTMGWKAIWGYGEGYDDGITIYVYAV